MDGRGRPTQVHLMVRLKALPDAICVMRFQGLQMLAAVIQALTSRRASPEELREIRRLLATQGDRGDRPPRRERDDD